jgi:hypothetical protein
VFSLGYGPNILILMRCVYSEVCYIDKLEASKG